MLQYEYHKLTNPTEQELNEYGQDGFRIAFITMDTRLNRTTGAAYQIPIVWIEKVIDTASQSIRHPAPPLASALRALSDEYSWHD
jgi:hypothetical protein